MKKYLIILFCLFFTSCLNLDGINNQHEEIKFDEKANQLKFEIINDTNTTYRFHPDYLLYSIKEIDDFSQDGVENNIILYIEDSNSLTIEYDQGYLTFIYDTPYPTSNMTFNLIDKIGKENIDDYKLKRLTDKYQYTITELYDNEITVIGELYNMKSNKTYILSILIRRIVRY